eukprot:g5868.t1
MKEIETLRQSFNSLKAELELLQTPEEGPLKPRAIGLRILKDRIEAVLDDNQIGKLNGRLQKAETALANERQRCAELEGQFREQSLSQEDVTSMKAKLKQSEKELSDLQRSYEELKRKLEASDTLLDEKRIEEDDLKTALHHERMELTIENKKLSFEKSKETGALTNSLEAARNETKRVEERVRHLERLVKKLTEESMPEDAVACEVGENSDQANFKPSTSLPDPPSADEPTIQGPPDDHEELKAQKCEIDQVNEELSDLEQFQKQETKATNQQNVALEEDNQEIPVTREDSPEASRRAGQNWTWGVSGLWSYVTGDNT